MNLTTPRHQIEASHDLIRPKRQQEISPSRAVGGGEKKMESREAKKYSQPLLFAILVNLKTANNEGKRQFLSLI